MGSDSFGKVGPHTTFHNNPAFKVQLKVLTKGKSAPIFPINPI